MNIVALTFAAVAVVSAVGLIAWAGFGMARANADLRSFIDRAPPFPDKAHSPVAAQPARAPAPVSSFHHTQQGLS